MDLPRRPHQRSSDPPTDAQWTTNSAFADSAVDVATQSARTPEHLGKGQDQHFTSNNTTSQTSIPPSSASPTLPPDYVEDEAENAEIKSDAPATATASDKLRQLAAVAWALELDDEMTEARKQKIQAILERLENVMEADEVSGHSVTRAGDGNDDVGIEEEAAHPATDQSEGSDGRANQDENSVADEEYVDEADLYNIRESLMSTVSAMRLRSQEQKHLHQLTVSKLEAVAQRCLAQESVIAELKPHFRALETEREDLRVENRTLGTENDDLRRQNEELRAQLSHLQSEVEKQANALSAMGSAMTGLEGWIDSNNHHHDQRHQVSKRNLKTAPESTPAPLTTTTSRPTPRRKQMTKTVIRGTGRFRGRYQVDVDDWGDDNVDNSNSNAFANSNHHPIWHNHNSHNLNGYDNFNGYDNDHDPQNFLDSYGMPDGGGGGAVGSGKDDTLELQDDVRAWIRGCRDVLEYAAAASSSGTGLDVNPTTAGDVDAGSRQQQSSKQVHRSNSHQARAEEDDWGEFQHAQ